MCMQAPWFADETLTRFARTLSAPIFLSLARHGEGFGVLDLHPIRRAPGAVKRAKPLRYNPFTAKLARLAEYDLAIFLDMLIVRSRNHMRSSIETAQKRVESVWSRPSGVRGWGRPGPGAASYPAGERRPACFEDEKASASLKIGAAISSIARRNAGRNDEMCEEHRRRRMIESPGRRKAASCHCPQ